MARLTNIVLNVTSLLLVVVGLALIGTFFFGSPVVGSAASGPEDFNVPVIAEKAEAVQPPESDPSNVVSPVPEDKTLEITIPKMARVANAMIPYTTGSDEEALRNHAAIHLAGSGFPWEKEANIYVAGHRLGYPNTGSFLAFFDLNKLEKGDKVIVTDANDKRYEYRVFKTFVVDPNDTYVTKPIDGKNVVTLQTCTLPDYSQRLIVQAEKVQA